MNLKYPARQKPRHLTGSAKTATSLIAQNCPSDEDALECAVCCAEVSQLHAHPLCGHSACGECWMGHVVRRIEAFQMQSLSCVACDEALGLHLVRFILLQVPAFDGKSDGGVLLPFVSTQVDGKEVFGLLLTEVAAKAYLVKYDQFLLMQYLTREPELRWCPNGCGYGVIAKGCKNCPRIECQSPKCAGRAYCYFCQQAWLDDRHQCPPGQGMAGDSSGGGDSFLHGVRLVAFHNLRSLFHQITGQMPSNTAPANSEEQQPPANTQAVAMGSTSALKPNVDIEASAAAQPSASSWRLGLGYPRRKHRQAGRYMSGVKESAQVSEPLSNGEAASRNSVVIEQ